MLVPKSFTDLITFSRSSAGWYYNSAGVLVQAGANIPRFDYDPVTRQPKGVLIEEGRTNLAIYSEDFANTSWQKTGATVSANAAVSPSGSVTADMLMEDTSTGLHSVQTNIGNATAGDARSGMIFVKEAGRQFIRLRVGRSDNEEGAVFDLSSGATVRQGANVTRAAIIPLTGGWFCLQISVSILSTNTLQYFNVSLMQSATTFSYEGNGSSGVHLWGAQAEIGTFSTSYIPTAGAQAARAEDVLVVPSLGPWFNATEWTLAVDWSVDHPVAGNRGPFWLNNNTIVRGVGIYYPSPLAVRGLYRDDDGKSIETPSLSPGERSRAALAYKGGTLSMSVNGSDAASRTVEGVGTPSVDNLRIGYFRAGGSNTGPLNGHVQGLRFWPYRLTDAELKALTT